MQIHLRFLDGIITLDKPNFRTSDIIVAVKAHTSDREKMYLGAFDQQIVVRCEREEETGHIQDGDVFNIFIKPIFDFPYVKGFDFSQFYLKNNDAIGNHLNKIVWINDLSTKRFGVSQHKYEITKWDADTNFCTISYLNMF